MMVERKQPEFGQEGSTISIKDLLSSYFAFAKEPTEEEINHNISQLLDYPWFRELFEQKELQEIIMTDKEIRRMIGRENVRNLKLYPKKQLKIRNQIVNALFFEIQSKPQNKTPDHD